MSHPHEDTPAEFDDVVRRLNDEQPEVSEFELDELKLRAKRRAMGSPSNGGALKSRFVTGLAVFGLLIGGTGGVIASSGGGATNGNNSANSQYCPPNSPGAGKPKHQGGGNKCGQPGGNGRNGHK